LIGAPNTRIRDICKKEIEQGREAHIDAAVEAMGLERRPEAETLFTNEFLPPLEERRLP
jgi:hypothetical protein